MKLLFSAVILANAALIFWVELLFAKRLLPTLGGAPAVWNTCLMFYQVVLLAGYAYALGVNRLELRRQVVVHGGVMMLVLVALPWFLFVWPDPGGRAPVPWLLALLSLSVGAPFFVLAAGAPLLQRWFSLSGHRDRGDPYFLFAASNFGSFLGLAAYPVVLEPLLSLEWQTALWKLSHGAVGVLVLVSGVWALRGGGKEVGPGVPGRGRAARGAQTVSLELGGSDPAPAVPGEGGSGPAPGSAGLDGAPPTPRRRLAWVGLAFLPSSLLLGVTTHITSEIAPVPLLWVVPLALYLLSFVLAFGPWRDPGDADRAVRSRRLVRPGAVALAGVLLAGWATGRLPDPAWLMVAANLAVLFVAGVVCHTRVARDRPPPRHLAEFYLWIAVGGALGGAFNTLVAPALFTDPLEYPLALAVLAFLVSAGSRARGAQARGAQPRPRGVEARSCGVEVQSRGVEAQSCGAQVRPGDLLLGLLPGAAAFLIFQQAAGLGLDPLLLFLVPAVLCLALAGRPARFGLGIAGLVLIGFTYPPAGGEVVFKERTFYGIHRVYQDGEHLWLAHGSTIHGGQRRGRADVPLTYYHPLGPAGSLFAAFDAARPVDVRAEGGTGAGVAAAGGMPNGAGEAGERRVAVVGLGTGSMIAYGREGQRWTFYELDPTVARIAEDPRLFTYLSDARAPYRTVLGDARLSLERSQGGYDLLVVDAFSSDAVPVHLLTREAVQLYRDRLRPGGWIAFHISNRYADFSGVLATLAEESGLTAYEARDEPADPASGRYASHWAVLADRPLAFSDARWRELAPTGGRGWTDSYSSLFQVLRW